MVMTANPTEVNPVLSGTKAPYCQDSALLTDLYQLTMAYAYWKSGNRDKEAVFTLSFRKNPFQGGFAVFSGLNQVLEYVSNLHFAGDDLAYLDTLEARDGSKLFDGEFLEYLSDFRYDVDIDCVPEGTIVFPHEPILKVQGPIIPAQLLETALLNLVCFPTLVATKAARIKLAAGNRPVFEFGLRRAQGPDGGLTASVAAYVGGCDGTSNVLAGKLFGIPVMGTHAHSWVMSFSEELEAFTSYARALPNNCVFLVDTYDTVNGVKNAIEVGNLLKEEGHELLGIRLDSGDLAYLSVEARRLLDAAGFERASIIASNDLDESVITSLNDQGAAIDIWAVGTKLVTCDPQPSLGGVYKLSAERSAGETSWRRCVKISEQSIKTSNPGLLQVRRFRSGAGDDSEFVGDMIFDEELIQGDEWLMVDPVDFTRRKRVTADMQYTDLLEPAFRRGEPVRDPCNLADARDSVLSQLAGFHSGIKRLLNPHQYPAGLESTLHALKTELILKGREI